MYLLQVIAYIPLMRGCYVNIDLFLGWVVSGVGFEMAPIIAEKLLRYFK